MTDHTTDISKTGIASVLATVVDGVIFALLMRLYAGTSLEIPGLWAAFGAIVGGATHYALCAFWVFRRFEHRPTRAIPSYIFVSGVAALGHGMFMQGLCFVVPQWWAWAISKVVLFLCWTYPLSRFVIFDQRSASP